MDILVVFSLFVNISLLMDKHICMTTEEVTESTTRQQYSDDTTISQGPYHDDVTDDVIGENEEARSMYGDYGNYYYYYGYSGTNPIEMSFDIVDTYLDKNETKDFLNSFDNTVQREIIRKQLRYCPFINLCNFSFGLVNEHHRLSCCAPCSCNISECLKYETCCPDLLNSTFYLDSTKDQIDDVVNSAISKVQKESFTCTFLHVKKISFFEQMSAYMYGKCPRDANSSIAKMCTREYTNDTESIKDMTPVTVSSQIVSYRNKYCALCNGVAENEIKFWDLHLACNRASDTELSAIVQNENTLFNFMLYSNKCDLGFLPRDEDQIRYCQSAISSCNETGLWKKYDVELELGCSLYTSTVKGYSKIFRNVFCLICNGYEAEEPLEKCDTYIPGGGGSFSFSGLIKMSPHIDEEENYDQISCNKSTILDTTTGRCLPLFCNELYTLQRGKCVKTFEIVRGVVYTVYLRLIPVEPLTVSETHLMIEDILVEIEEDIFKNPNYFSELVKSETCDVQLIYRANLTYKTDNSYAITGDSDLLSIDARFKLYVKECDPYNFANILNSLGNNNISYGLGKSEIVFKIDVRDDSFNLGYDIVHMMSYLSESYTSPPLSVLVRHSASDKDGYTLIPCIRYTTNFCPISREFNAVAIRECPMVKLSITGLSNKEKHMENTFVYQNFSFHKTEFTFEDNTTIKVCVDAFLRFLEQNQKGATDTVHANDIVELVSIICVSLSIVCLLVTLFTFAFFPSLRTFPGMNTFSLCLFLILAQSLYLIGSFAKISSETIWCKVLGMLIHFFWLTAIFWMNICTFHMFRVLTHTRARSAAKWSTFVTYHIYSFGLSCSCIVINVGFSWYFNNSIGYGQHVCYISTELMKTYTFGLPVLVVILANVAMFSAVMISVKRKASIHQTSSVERNDFLIFIKLSSLTGFSWLFGFIFYWTEMAVFSYIFIVLNSTQGVFLMFSFVINKRILYLYKTTLQKVGKPHLSQSGSRTYHVKVHGTDSKLSVDNCTLSRQNKRVGSSCSSYTTSL